MRGGQRQALLLAEGLAKRGDCVSFLARRGGPLFEQLRAKGWLVVDATLSNIYRESKRADLIHAHDARAHTLSCLAARAPLIVGRRVAFPIRKSLLSRLKYRQPAGYLAVSRAVADRLKRAQIPNKKIYLVHDGVLPSERLWSWNPGSPLVTFASDDPAKGADLIQAAAGHWGDAPLLFSRDLHRDLPRASAFLYITRSEGLGSAALLAMSMGVPVIASAVGGLLEVFDHDRSGVHVANDPAAIAAAVARVTTDRNLAERLSQNGWNRVRADFSVDAMVENTLAVYRKIL